MIGTLLCLVVVPAVPYVYTIPVQGLHGSSSDGYSLVMLPYTDRRNAWVHSAPISIIILTLKDGSDKLN